MYSVTNIFSHLFLKLSINPTKFTFMVRGFMFLRLCGPPKYFSMFHGPQAKKGWEVLGNKNWFQREKNTEPERQREI